MCFRVNPHKNMMPVSSKKFLDIQATIECGFTPKRKEFLDIQATIECGFTSKCIRDMTRTYSQMHHTDKYSEHSSISLAKCWVFIYELSGFGFESSCSHLNCRFCTCFKEGVPWNSGNYRMWIHSETHTWHGKDSQMHHTDKYLEHSWIIWPNGWVFVYELSGSGFEPSSNHLNFRFRTCFKQGIPWHSGNYRVWIHSETRIWHDKNIQSNAS